VDPAGAKERERAERRQKELEEKKAAARAVAAAERSAAAAYREKSFEAAVSTLRAAAEKASGDAAAHLAAVAGDYEAVAAALAKGDRSAAANAPAAMTAYGDALRADGKNGKGAHAAYIRAQLAKVAPRAAVAHYDKQRYEQAKSACDAAMNYGAGTDPQVTRVRGLLESKAKELYAQALQAQRTDPARAKLLWGRVIKMVPPDSPWYTKAFAALNKGAARPPGE